MLKHPYKKAALSILVAMCLIASGCAAPSSSAISASSSSAPVSQSQAQPLALDTARAVSVLECSGAVQVTSNGEKVDAFRGMRLRQGDSITTGAGAVAYLDLDGDKLVTMDENTEVRLDVLSEKEQNQKTELTLLSGTASNSISKLKDASSYNVKTSNFTMGVRGTIFVVQVARDGQSPTVSVVEGAVEVKPQTATQEGMMIGAQQAVSPTEALWDGFVEHPANPVAQPIQLSSLSTTVLSSILVELENRAQALPEQREQFIKTMEEIKSISPEAAAAAPALKQHLEDVREKPALTPPITQPVTPSATTPPNKRPAPPSATAAPEKPTVTPPPATPEPTNPDNSGSMPKPPQPSPTPKPVVKLKTPEVEIHNFTQNVINISFPQVPNAVSYSISVMDANAHNIFTHSLPAPVARTVPIYFESSFSEPIKHSGRYTLVVTAIADRPEKNSIPFRQAKDFDISEKVFEITSAKLTYLSLSFDLVSYPTGVDCYDVQVQNATTNTTFLQVSARSDAHFEMNLDQPLASPGIYDVLVTPKSSTNPGATFAPYRYPVSIEQYASPELIAFELSHDLNFLVASLKKLPSPSVFNEGLKIALYKDGVEVPLADDWSYKEDSTTAPQTIAIRYAPAGVPTKIPAGDYTIKVKIEDAQGRKIPSAQVSKDTHVLSE